MWEQRGAARKQVKKRPNGWQGESGVGGPAFGARDWGSEVDFVFRDERFEIKRGRRE